MSDASVIAAGLSAISAWLDEANRGRPEVEVALFRVDKVLEEIGEAHEALAGWRGTNPRKGVTCGAAEVVDELLDVAVTALEAADYLQGDQAATWDQFVDLMTDEGDDISRVLVYSAAEAERNYISFAPEMIPVILVGNLSGAFWRVHEALIHSLQMPDGEAREAWYGHVVAGLHAIVAISLTCVEVLTGKQGKSTEALAKKIEAMTARAGLA